MSEQKLVLGDCLDVFREVRGLQAIVTDPPAGIGFMGRSWDKDRGGRAAWIAYWAERFAVALDACEDNAVGLFWALPRTQHWTATAVEDAGWKIRDVITHHFGQGWPKDKNALKPASEAWILAVKGKPALGIDACRVERGVDLQPVSNSGRMGYGGGSDGYDFKPSPNGSWPTNALLSHAESCQPCGTRKVRGSAPASGPTLTGASTSSARGKFNGTAATPSYGGDDQTETIPAYLCAVGCDCGRSWLAESGGEAPRCECGLAGWWACPVAEMDAQSGELHPPGNLVAITRGKSRAVYGNTTEGSYKPFKDQGGAARFFPRFGYHAKAPSGERHAGCENLLWRVDNKDPFGFVRVSRDEWEALDPKDRAEGNVHPTVKRLSLMRWFHKLATSGLRLEPFRTPRVGDLCGGSGSGMVAAYLDDIEWIGAEVCPQAIEIANARLAFWKGLSFEARERFLTDDVVPKAREAVDGQRRLF